MTSANDHDPVTSAWAEEPRRLLNAGRTVLVTLWPDGTAILHIRPDPDAVWSSPARLHDAGGPGGMPAKGGYGGGGGYPADDHERRGPRNPP